MDLKEKLSERCVLEESGYMVSSKLEITCNRFAASLEKNVFRFWLGYIRTWFQFYVLEIIFSWLGHFNFPELDLCSMHYEE